MNEIPYRFAEETKPQAMIGVGDFGGDASWVTERMNGQAAGWDPVGLVDDNESLWGGEVDSCPVLGPVSICERLGCPVWTVCSIETGMERFPS